MFDLNSPEDLFFYIKDSMDRYLANEEKKISDVFFLIMGLNHLREWIAPNYDPKFNKQKKIYEWKATEDDASIFSKDIYEQEQFAKLRRVCNGTKHLSNKSPATSASYDLAIDSWSAFDSVKEADKGPSSGFFVEGAPLEDILSGVISYYENHWFSKKA